MNETKSSSQNQPAQVFSKIWHGIRAYLTNWRNLLGHSLLGVLFLVLAIRAPVQVWIKLVTIICLIAINILRMRLKTRRAARQTAEVEEYHDELV